MYVFYLNMFLIKKKKKGLVYKLFDFRDIYILMLRLYLSRRLGK